MRLRLMCFVSFVMLLFLIPVMAARADAPPQIAGTIEARLGDRSVQLPSLKTDVRAEVMGDLATVTVVQTFANPYDRPLHARYLFPLNHNAAVHEMWMEIGAERIRAQIQERQQAQKTFERAKSEGRAAALLEEHRPNLFTQRIANLMPGLPIQVTLRYVQTVPRVDGAYELVVPLVVGPRFQPPQAGQVSWAGDAASPATPRDGVWALDALPDHAPVLGLHVPEQVETERVTIDVDLRSGLPIREASSRTHRIDARTESQGRWRIGLAQQRVVDNRDFVLRYRLAGDKTAAGLLVQRDGGEGYFSLLIEPPMAPGDAEIAAREMVFLLDSSGSMYGLPLDASKAFMREALRKLRPTDSFRIIQFGSDVHEFADAPLPATPAHIARGIAYTNGLQGMGGTMMSLGVRQALEAPTAPGVKRIVVFLTDGYIGNEVEILRLVQERLGDARLYAFGVGAGVNRFLLDELGRTGRGFTRYMDPTEDTAHVVAELTDRLQSPVLTDIEIDWNGLAVADVMPQRIPDLFAGDSIRVQGRYLKPGVGTVRIHGNSRGRRATLLVPVSLPEKTTGGEAVGLIWARAAIAEAMYQMTLPPMLFKARGESAPEFETLKRRVTDLGLRFSLVTKWTSFVAVSEQIYNANVAGTPERPVPLPQVAGVSPRAYAPATIGAAGPEASTWAALLVLMALMAWVLRRAGGTGESRRAVAFG
ncbi:MAG TPA: VIT domain-containing protein [Solimonas sp.]